MNRHVAAADPIPERRMGCLTLWCGVRFELLEPILDNDKLRWRIERASDHQKTSMLRFAHRLLGAHELRRS
jgi:hypothetical protein